MWHAINFACFPTSPCRKNRMVVICRVALLCLSYIPSVVYYLLGLRSDLARALGAAAVIMIILLKPNMVTAQALPRLALILYRNLPVHPSYKWAGRPYLRTS
ncbi:hypothetical protein DFH09DRAFT_1143111 [Mycena vulgaris]|nr:hypothetical protein DFH09DRAFT_1143111 [Mycena vulgaris]